jgi:hypothetical protein
MRRRSFIAQTFSLIACAAGLRSALISAAWPQAQFQTPFQPPRQIPFQAPDTACIAQGMLPRPTATVLHTFAADSSEGNDPARHSSKALPVLNDAAICKTTEPE